MAKQNPTQWVAGNIRAEVARRRVHSQDLADLLGISLSGMHRRLSGRTPFTLAELILLAEYFGLPVTEFIDERVAA